MPRPNQHVRTEADRERLALATREALQLRIGGATLAQIATQQGISVPTAHERVKRALREITLAPATELKKLEDERLTALLRSLWAIAMGGTREAPVPIAERLTAAREVRMLSESLRKLHGLDAPQRRILEVVTEDEMDRLIKQLSEEVAELEGDGQVEGEPVAA